MITWQTPYTAWSNGNFFTYEDANRIAGNINFLYPSANLKENYTNNDFLTQQDFNAWSNALNSLIVSSGLGGAMVGYDGTADTFNAIEQLLQDLYNRIGLNNAQVVANIYSGDDLFTASPTENYVRGI